jgi:hypothetical protein
MAITQEEAGELSGVISPVIAALALKAWTAAKETEDTFTGKDLEDGVGAEAERIYEGLKDALNEVEGAIEAPEPSELEALLNMLAGGVLTEGDDPLDLSL